ncbi:MAG: response regulator transcription factor [Candidatus Obscuribacterales bacterium]|nr:response regulator transcription factor [Candidatus Obscuribacterales bacterium]
MSKLLLVEDDVALRDMTAKYLKSANFLVDTVGDGSDAFELLRFSSFDLVVLDWELPGLSGPEVLQKYRNKGGKTPVLMLTGKNTLSDKTAGFGAGADDYLTKPFELEELLLRIQAILRRSNPVAPNNVLKARDIELDTAALIVTRAGITLKLLPKEISLLEYLLRHPGQVFSADQLLDRVWSSSSDATTEAVTACVGRLRKKIDSDSDKPLIKTIYGLGYKLEDS